MRDLKTKMICLSIVGVIFYFIYNQPKTDKKMQMNKQRVSAAQLNANALQNPNAFINADMTTGMNDNVQRSQQSQLDVDRLPLVEETSHIIPANEIIQMNYKDCTFKDKVEKELYTADAPLFTKEKTNLVPLDINDSSHRRVNFY
jgi:hypothetical protein